MIYPPIFYFKRVFFMFENNFSSKVKKVFFVNKRAFAKRLLMVLAFLLTALISGLGSVYIYKEYHPTPSEKIQQIDGLIKKHYFGDIDQTKLDDTLAKAYIKAIDDKYGFYKSTEEAVEITNSFKGNDVGIGVTVYFGSSKNTLNIFRVDNDGPASNAGIMVGDKIVSIDGKTVEELGYTKAIKLLGKKAGETAEIGVLRGEKNLKFSIEYKEFERQSVYSEKIKDFGYICFTEFNSASVNQFKNAFAKLKEQNVKGLIFDLRDNGGGTVDSTCEILDILVGECNIMTTRYAGGETEVNYTSDKNKTDLPMCVLVNNETASASELFAATIKSVEKGVLIGNKTYGKGVVQRTYYLPDKSCVRFTVGEFFAADEKSFNNIGITPDYEVVLSEKQQENRFALGENDPYILKAEEVLNGVIR